MSISLTSGSIVICSEHRICQSPLYLRTSSSQPLSLFSCNKQLSLHQFTHISRTIKVTARSAMMTTAETISSGVPNNTMKLLFVEMGVGLRSARIVNVEVVDGGLICSSGVLVEKMGDTNEDCYIVNVAVYVGY
ncbi:hypothetical protein AtEden1_Chr1g0037811 [Arabidopsis thaliana]